MTETYCRLCAELTSSDNLVTLIDSIECQKNLVYKIFECFRINIRLTDNLPKYICSECYKQVLNTYEFTEKIQRGQNTLTSLFIQLDDKSNANASEGDFIYSAGHFVDVKHEPFSDEESEAVSNTPPTEEETKQSADNFNMEFKNHLELHKLKEIKGWKNYIWTCNACETEFQTVKELREHYEQGHNTSVQYTCMECSKLFSAFDPFRRHVKRHWNKYRYQCDVCGKYFHGKSHHEKHMVVHSEDRKFMCSTCGESFKTQQTLNNHMRTHLPDDQKPECDVCHKTFSTAQNLTEHKKIHEGLKHTCEQCGRTFTQKRGLEKHITSLHTDELPCSCPVCRKVFKSAFNLRRHQKEHTDIKRHECEVCGRKFRLSFNLKEHSTIHSGELPHECEHCKKCFRLKANLKTHLRQHTGERPFSCLECTHDFVNHSNFMKHLKRRHGLEKVSLVNQRQYPFSNTNDKESENVDELSSFNKL